MKSLVLLLMFSSLCMQGVNTIRTLEDYTYTHTHLNDSKNKSHTLENYTHTHSHSNTVQPVNIYIVQNNDVKRKKPDWIAPVVGCSFGLFGFLLICCFRNL
jgi:hypothetical protein